MTLIHTETPQRTHPPLSAAILVPRWLAVFALWIAGIVVLSRLGLRIDVLTRDPVEVTRAPVETGAITHLGLLLWGAAAALPLLVAATLRGRRDVAMFLALGLASLVMGFDDAFLVHEVVLPELGIPENIVLAAYVSAAIAATAFLAFRVTFLAPALPVLALACFAGSLAVDVTYSGEEVEDVLKLAGIATLIMTAVVEGRARIAPVAGPTGARDD